MSDISIIQLNNTECSNPSYLGNLSSSLNHNNGIREEIVAKNNSRTQKNINLKGNISNKTKMKKNALKTAA